MLECVPITSSQTLCTVDGSDTGSIEDVHPLVCCSVQVTVVLAGPAPRTAAPLRTVWSAVAPSPNSESQYGGAARSWCGSWKEVEWRKRPQGILGNIVLHSSVNVIGTRSLRWPEEEPRAFISKNWFELFFLWIENKNVGRFEGGLLTSSPVVNVVSLCPALRMKRANSLNVLNVGARDSQDDTQVSKLLLILLLWFLWCWKLAVTETCLCFVPQSSSLTDNRGLSSSTQSLTRRGSVSGTS